MFEPCIQERGVRGRQEKMVGHRIKLMGACKDPAYDLLVESHFSMLALS
jgi:hypothetical protein